MSWIRSRTTAAAAGVVAGSLLMVGALAVVHGIADAVDNPYSHTKPGVATGSCDGARYDAIAEMAANDRDVTVRVIIEDHAQREWQVRWVGFGWSTRAPFDTEVGFAHAVETLGDLDDGGARRVALRPLGTASWCRVTASLR